MTVSKAKIFIKRGMSEDGLRQRLNRATDLKTLGAVLEDETLLFSDMEFEEAFTIKLTQCQEAEQAGALNEFRMWWGLLKASVS